MRFVIYCKLPIPTDAICGDDKFYHYAFISTFLCECVTFFRDVSLVRSVVNMLEIDHQEKNKWAHKHDWSDNVSSGLAFTILLFEVL